MIISVILLAASCSGPACCIRHGVPAICRSPAIEQQAKAIVLRKCRRLRERCDPSRIDTVINDLQINEGAYESPEDLARDALLHVRR